MAVVGNHGNLHVVEVSPSKDAGIHVEEGNALSARIQRDATSLAGASARIGRVSRCSLNFRRRQYAWIGTTTARRPVEQFQPPANSAHQAVFSIWNATTLAACGVRTSLTCGPDSRLMVICTPSSENVASMCSMASSGSSITLSTRGIGTLDSSGCHASRKSCMASLWSSRANSDVCTISPFVRHRSAAQQQR